MADEKVATVDNSGLANLASLFLGKNTKTSFGGSTSTNQTTTESVSPDAVNALIKQMLEGSQGLAAVAQGQKTAGLYNSSTNQLLVNDLLSRTAGQAAALNKTSTVANTVADNRTQNAATAPQVSPALGLGLLGGAQLLSSMGGISSIGKLLGLKSAADVITPKVTGAGTAKTQVPADDGTTDGIQATIDGLPSTGTAGNAAQGDIAQLVQQHLDTTSGYGLAGASIAPTILESTPVAPDIGDIGVGLPTLSDSGVVADFGANIGADIGSSFDGTGVDLGATFGDTGVDYNNVLDYSEFNFAKGGFVPAQRKPKGYAEGGEVSKDVGINGLTLDSQDIRKQLEARLLNLNPNTEPQNWPDLGKKYSTTIAKTPELYHILELLNILTPGWAEVGRQPVGAGRGRVNPANVTPGYAEGGLVNTGLRPTATSRPTGLGVDSSVVDAVVNSITPTPNQSAPLAQKNTAVTARTTATATPVQAQTAARKVNQSGEANTGNSSTPGVGTTPGAASSGLGTNPTGLSLGLSSVGVSAPGLAGLASAPNNTSAVNSTVSGLASSIGGLAAGLPGAIVSGLVSSLLMGQANAGTPSTPGAVAASNANNAATNTGMDPLDAFMAFIGASDQGDSTAPGVSTSGGIGVGDSSGASVGTSGDGGVGAGAAMKGGGKVPGDDPTHSDTVEANLTAGEFVINRNATQMFRPILEMINNMVPATPMATRK